LAPEDELLREKILLSDTIDLRRDEGFAGDETLDIGCGPGADKPDSEESTADDKTKVVPVDDRVDLGVTSLSATETCD